MQQHRSASGRVAVLAGVEECRGGTLDTFDAAAGGGGVDDPVGQRRQSRSRHVLDPSRHVAGLTDGKMRDKLSFGSTTRNLPQPRKGTVMFARVNSTRVTADELAGLITFSEAQLPAAREASGFKGLYLLADRQSGKIVSISLWDSDDDLRQFEARGARLRSAANAELGIAPTPVESYEVVLQA